MSSTSEQQEKERKKCDEYVEAGLTRNMTIRFLIDKLRGMGCEPPAGFIRCKDCGTDKQAGAGFGVKLEQEECPESLLQQARDAQLASGDTKLKPEIFLCQNHVRDKTHAHESMAHELIHAIDLCRTHMDPLNNCIHLACTEIRAENLSGECRLGNELSRIMSSREEHFAKHQQSCVKRRAALSLKANPKCAAQANDYIDAAFERCYKDTFPFDRHPNLR